MIMYFSSGRTGTNDLLSRPEYLFSKTNLMMSFHYAKKDSKRFLKIIDKRKKQK